MKNLILSLVVLVLLFGSSCKRVYYCPEGGNKDGKETYIIITDKSQIQDASSWKIIETKPFGKAEEPYWILQSGNSKVTVRNIYEYYWKPEYVKGKVVSGAFVKSVY